MVAPAFIARLNVGNRSRDGLTIANMPSEAGAAMEKDAELLRPDLSPRKAHQPQST